MESVAPVLQALAKLKEVKIFTDETSWAQAAGVAPVAVVDESRLCLFMQIDRNAERLRLDKELGRLDAEIAKAQGKLDNDAFVARAPSAVIELERNRLASFMATREKIRDQMVRLG